MRIGSVDRGAERSDLRVEPTPAHGCTILARSEHQGPWDASWTPWSVGYATGTRLRWRGEGWTLDGPNGPVANIPWPLPSTSAAPDPSLAR